MPRNELHYFDREENFAKGENWYRSHFAEAKHNQVVGEKTPDYIWTNCKSKPDVSELKHKRIYEFRNDIKLVVIFRNPVERFVSAFHHNQRLGRLPQRLAIADLLKCDRYQGVLLGMLERGKYSTQLREYFRFFDSTQMKFVFHEDIRSDPDGVLLEIQDFLGVEPQVFSGSNKKRYNDYQATKLGADLVGRANGTLKYLAIKLDRFLFSRLPLPKVQYPSTSASEREYLTAYYRSEIKELPELVGRSLPPDWYF